MISANEASRLFDSCAIEARRKRIAFRLEYIEHKIKKACEEQERYIDVDIDDDIRSHISDVLVNLKYEVTAINKGLSIGW